MSSAGVEPASAGLGNQCHSARPRGHRGDVRGSHPPETDSQSALVTRRATSPCMRTCGTPGRNRTDTVRLKGGDPEPLDDGGRRARSPEGRFGATAEESGSRCAASLSCESGAPARAGGKIRAGPSEDAVGFPYEEGCLTVRRLPEEHGAGRAGRAGWSRTSISMRVGHLRADELGAHVRNRTGTSSLRVRLLDHRASWAKRENRIRANKLRASLAPAGGIEPPT